MAGYWARTAITARSETPPPHNHDDFGCYGRRFFLWSERALGARVEGEGWMSEPNGVGQEWAWHIYIVFG